MHTVSYTNKGTVVSEALQRTIALEALNETTNGNSDGVVMNPAC